MKLVLFIILNALQAHLKINRNEDRVEVLHFAHFNKLDENNMPSTMPLRLACR